MSLSNYPPGFNGGIESEDEVKLTCKTCGKEWTAKMCFELGGWFFADEDKATCDVCDNGEEPSIH